VNGAALLAEIAATFGRFVALPPFADSAITLWTVHAHALEGAAASSPPASAARWRAISAGASQRVAGQGRSLPKGYARGSVLLAV
jgi:hypothetical protein